MSKINPTILTLKKHGKTVTIAEPHSHQKSGEMAEIFYRIMLAHGYHPESVLSGMEECIQEHS